MQNIISSQAAEVSTEFVQSKRKGRENNVAWLERHLGQLTDSREEEGLTYLVLLGGRARTHFRLRVAQSHLRHDFTPSHWSHAMLLGKSGYFADRKNPVAEISLEPKAGFGFPAETNGRQKSDLSLYKSRYNFPNVGVLELPIQVEAVAEALERFEKQRAALDAVELLVLWLGYLWGVSDRNPLVEGYGIPGAGMIETVAGAAGYDLTPGLESRASCPEAMWQAARWWHGYYREERGRAPRGFWHMEHFLGK